MHKIIFSPIDIDELVAKIKSAIIGDILSTKGFTDDTVNSEKYLTTKELCKYLRVSEPTIGRWRKKNKIRPLKIGSCIRYNLSAVLSALEKGKK